MVLWPRLGKYGPDGKPRAILGHNLPMAALGVFILWLGWFGFNPGSTNVADGSIGRIAVTTNFAAATGTLGALIASWILLKKPEMTMTLNGCLAGLVAVTAGCATVTPTGAAIIGFMAGILVVLAVLFFDRIAKIDDPVGAVSVHGVCGSFGTLMCGFFNAEGVIDAAKTSTGLLYGGGFGQTITQLIGMATAFGWAFGCGLVIFFGIKYTIGLRVTEEEELRGLDIDEHGNEAYAGFQIFSNQ
jgi:Amt family ammonium transporter